MRAGDATTQGRRTLQQSSLPITSDVHDVGRTRRRRKRETVSPIGLLTYVLLGTCVVFVVVARVIKANKSKSALAKATGNARSEFTSESRDSLDVELKVKVNVNANVDAESMQAQLKPDPDVLGLVVGHNDQLGVVGEHTDGHANNILSMYGRCIQKGADVMLFVGAPCLVPFTNLNAPIVIALGAVIGAIFSRMNLDPILYQ
jgi:hypothetical protein